MTRIRMPESETEYRNALVDAAELGAKKALVEVGVLKPYISEREAFRRYGEAVVRRWVEEGLIHPEQDGPNLKKRINRLQIESVAKVSNRAAFYSRNE